MIEKIVIILTGAVIALESLALTIGITIVQRSNEWNAFKNIFFEITDILLGGLLVYLGVTAMYHDKKVILIIALGFLLLSHFYRVWENALGTDNPFCNNLPLFIFNNIRLIGVFAIMILVFGKYIQD